MVKKRVLFIFLAVPLVFLFFLGTTNKGSKVENPIFAEENYTISLNENFPENQIIFSSEIIELTNDEGQNYFVNYRIKREQLRQETKEMLLLLLESDIEQTREEAQKRWLDLSEKIAKEGEIEYVLKMKGYKDVVTDYNDTMINVTVLSEGLSLLERQAIVQVVAGITGKPASRIKLGEKN